jgi:sulfotransferase family protein
MKPPDGMTDELLLQSKFNRRQPGGLRLATAMLRSLPDFIVIGAQKSGTTSLYRYLSLHPRIRSARIKEVHYFDQNFPFGERWYRAQFPLGAWSRGRLVGEATPDYLFHPHAAERAAQLVPHAKLLVTLRNPVDRAYSHYQHVVARGHELLPFETALDNEKRVVPLESRRLLENPLYRSLALERHSYVARGEYSEQLQRWLRWFPREQLHLVIAEEMFGRTQDAMSGVFQFLGIPPLEVGSPEAFKSGSYSDGMSPDTRKLLIEHFRPHNARLEDLLGMRLDWDR